MERNYAARLSIAWVFGNEKFFKMAANTLVLLCKYNKDGQLIDPFGTRIDDLLPPGLLESILDVWREAMEDIIKIPSAELSRYEAAVSSHGPRYHFCQVQVSSQVRVACDTVIHGSLMRSLMSKGLYQKSVNELVSMPDIDLEIFADMVADLEILHITPAGEAHVSCYTHSACTTVNFVDAYKVVDNLRSPVLGSHIEHMRSQREKLGRTKSAKTWKKRKRSVACCR